MDLSEKVVPNLPLKKGGGGEHRTLKMVLRPWGIREKGRQEIEMQRRQVRKESGRRETQVCG